MDSQQTAVVATVTDIKKKNSKNPEDYPVGIITYEEFFTHEEMTEMESQIELTE